MSNKAENRKYPFERPLKKMKSTSRQPLSKVFREPLRVVDLFEELVIHQSMLEFQNRRMLRAQGDLSHISKQLRNLTLALSEAEERTREKIATLLHDDLQQHLAAIRFKLQILRRGRISEETRIEKLRKVEALIDECIQKTRSLSYDLCPNLLRRRGLLPALEWLAREMLEKHGLEVDLKLNPLSGPDSPALASMLFQSIKELLFNAKKHSGGKKALVEAIEDGDSLTITVADQGKGCIEREARKKDDGASSFGLFQIEERIKFLGGEFELDTAPGKGCRVTLRIPKAAENNKSEEPVMENSRPAGRSSDFWVHPPQRENKKIRILLADDHTAIREAMASLFENSKDFEVVGQAADGAEAVCLAELTIPDVILMDVSMPRMDGIEATFHIKRRIPNVRIIGLSMHEDGTTRQRMISAGASAYQHKAVHLTDLIKTIKNTCDK